MSAPDSVSPQILNLVRPRSLNLFHFGQGKAAIDTGVTLKMMAVFNPYDVPYEEWHVETTRHPGFFADQMEMNGLVFPKHLQSDVHGKRATDPPESRSLN